jgi:hypothetical protein
MSPPVWRTRAHVDTETPPNAAMAAASKEVAHVNSIKSQTTAQTPSFGMSAYGQTSLEASAIAAVAGVQVWTCARVRHIGGGMGLATTKGDFPEIRAWRPPTC